MKLVFKYLAIGVVLFIAFMVIFTALTLKYSFTEDFRVETPIPPYSDHSTTTTTSEQ